MTQPQASPESKSDVHPSGALRQEAEPAIQGSGSFTPGPWAIAHREPSEGYYKIERDERSKESNYNYRVAHVIDGNDYAQNTFNAYLIAAAPDLLEALRLLVSDILQGADPSDKECQRITGSWGKALAAIEKAHGGQS